MAKVVTTVEAMRAASRVHGMRATAAARIFRKAECRISGTQQTRIESCIVSSRERRLWWVAVLGHGPVVLWAVADTYVFVELGGLACPASTIALHFAARAVLIAARAYWLTRVWVGAVWKLRHFFDFADAVLAVGMIWENTPGGYERMSGTIALPPMVVSALVTLYVHRALRRANSALANVSPDP
jgi:hypothetical protein